METEHNQPQKPYFWNYPQFHLFEISVLVLSLTSCSLVTDYILKRDDGINLDAQIGTNENKVDTGIGALGLDTDTTISVEDSNETSIVNTDDRYHITTEGDTEINVYETNRWLYAVFIIYVLGKPYLRRYWKKRRGEQGIYPHEQCTYTSIRNSTPSDGNI